MELGLAVRSSTAGYYEPRGVVASRPGSPTRVAPNLGTVQTTLDRSCGLCTSTTQPGKWVTVVVMPETLLSEFVEQNYTHATYLMGQTPRARVCPVRQWDGTGHQSSMFKPIQKSKVPTVGNLDEKTA